MTRIVFVLFFVLLLGTSAAFAQASDAAESNNTVSFVVDLVEFVSGFVVAVLFGAVSGILLLLRTQIVRSKEIVETIKNLVMTVDDRIEWLKAELEKLEKENKNGNVDR